jgi:hypothetical protein
MSDESKRPRIEEHKTYHIEAIVGPSRGQLPERILMREDGWAGENWSAEPRHTEDYWYVPERRSEKVIVANGATGHCKCGSCGGLIGAWDNYCRHCGAKLEPEDPHLMRGGADE